MFFSPEACIGESYRGKMNDIWACGITLFYMAAGYYPFVATGMNYTKLHNLIQHTEPTYPEKIIGTPMHDLITKMLKKSIDERINSIEQIKKHPWITKNGTVPWEDPQVDAFEEPTNEDYQNLFTSMYHKAIYGIVK